MENPCDHETSILGKRSRFFPDNCNCKADIESTYKKCIEIATDVAEKLGPGHSETVYEAAIMNGLYDARIPSRRQVPYVQKINGYTLNIGTIDIEADHDIIIELKANHTLVKKEFRTQLYRYLRCKRAETTHDGPIIGCVFMFHKDGSLHVWRAVD